MALTRTISKSEEEQLYILEFFIERLDWHLNETQCENPNDLIVRIGFIDLEPFEIGSKEFMSSNGKGTDKENSNSGNFVYFNSGKSYLFTRAPTDLIKTVKSLPLAIEVFKVSNGDRARLWIARPPVNKSLYNKVIKTRNEVDDLPLVFAAKDTYTLTNLQGYPAASMSVCLKLYCFGNSVINHFGLQGKSFVFQSSCNENSYSKFFRKNSKKPKDCASKSMHKENTNNLNSAFTVLPQLPDLPSDTLRVSATEDIEDSVSSLKRPKSPPRISIDDPNFKNLTTAEKLNDRKYRELIYQTYPDEPTCHCLPNNQPTHPLLCRSGCNNSCCMKLRSTEILSANTEPVETNPTHTYCTESLKPKSLIKNASVSSVTRMRGGGDRGNIYTDSRGPTWPKRKTKNEHRDRIEKENRLKGGGEYQNPNPSTMSMSSKDPNADSDGACKPFPSDPTKTGCSCASKESSWRKGNAKCTKKPCMGIDCLIRAFKEAQDFVDSLGKVPGLVGLGLMDPSESPYFGRDIDKDYAPQESQTERRKTYGSGLQPLISGGQCGAPCNTQIAKLGTGMSSSSIPYGAPPPQPLTIAVPGRTGVVREATPTLPDASLFGGSVRQRRKEERKELEASPSVPLDVDVGPCGEPECRSRRRKPADNATTGEGGQEPVHKKFASDPSPSSNLNLQLNSSPSPYRSPNPNLNPYLLEAKASNPSMSNPSRIMEKERPRHQKGRASNPGPGGDRSVAGKAPVKVSKKVMRYVYSIGDAYPGINYGHKNCVDPRLRVPANMGWLWNTSVTVGKLKPRIGWKPGAIGRYLYEMLREAKAGSSVKEEPRPRSVPSRTLTPRKGKVYKSMSFVSPKKSQAKDGDQEMDAPPTLHIHRKDGTYYVTMYPIKQDTADETHVEEPMKPLQFKIVKNKDDASVASSSTASDMEIEFSPPAAVNRYRRKPDVIHVDTQVTQQEILDAFKPTESHKKKDKKAKRDKKIKK